MPKKKKSPSQAGRYTARGVSTTKSEVHDAIEKFDHGLFPGAFCKVTPDVLTGDPTRCNVIHADGSGTKSTLAYLVYRETGDPSVFRGIAQDSIVMNVDDLLCIGATGRILLSSTINRNARSIPGEVLGELIAGHEEFAETLRRFGIDIHLGGGETADVGDLTGTVVVDSCAVAVMDRKRVLDGRGIKPGLAIVGLASAGCASYETEPNSGIGSNGLTSARHDLLSPYYRKKYPETFDKNTDRELVYCGPHRLEDRLPGSSMTVGAAILSPTRTYAPVIHRLLEEMPEKVRGVIHCSGGAQTKCLRFGRGVHFVKDNLLSVPPIFAAIRKASGTSLKEMYQVFNMGHRMEIYCPKRAAKEVIAVATELGVEAQVVGRTERSALPGRANHLTLFHGKQKLAYRL